MNSFEKWWAAAAKNLIADGKDDELTLAALEAVANIAWAACEQQFRPQWQPFETAPKDGRSFVIKVGATVLISRYSDEFLVVTGDLPKGEHKWYWAEIPEMVEDMKNE